MIFKKKYRTCSKCDLEFPDSFVACPICHPSDFEMTPVNITIMIIMFIALVLGIYYMG